MTTSKEYWPTLVGLNLKDKAALQRYCLDLHREVAQSKIYSVIPEPRSGAPVDADEPGNGTDEPDHDLRRRGRASWTWQSSRI